MLVTRVTNAIGRARRTCGAAQLRVVDGPDRGLEIELPQVGVVIGTERACDVVLDRSVRVAPPLLDRADRARASRSPTSARSNGTVIDGVAVGKVVAPPGVALRIGKTLIQLMPADEVVDIPPSTSDRFGALYGGSIAMRQVFAILERAREVDRAGAVPRRERHRQGADGARRPRCVAARATARSSCSTAAPRPRR